MDGEMDGLDMCQIGLIYEDKEYSLQASLDFTGEIFMTQIMSIINVPLERMTVLGLPNNGYLLKDHTLRSQGLKNGDTLLLIVPNVLRGVKGTEQKRYFQDDKSVYDMLHVAGIQNTENTCYFNSVVQFLANMPELMTSLETYPLEDKNKEEDDEEEHVNIGINNRAIGLDNNIEEGPVLVNPGRNQANNNNEGQGQNNGVNENGNNNNNNNNNNIAFLPNQLVIEFGRFMNKLLNSNDTDTPLYPSTLLKAFRNEFPIFATKDERGRYIQQDAEEGLTNILTTLKSELVEGRCDIYKKVDKDPKLVSGKKADYVNEIYHDTVSRLLQCRMAPSEVDGELYRHPSYVDDGCLLVPIRVTSKTNSLEESLFFANPSEHRPRFLIEYAPNYLIIHFMRFNVMKNKNKRDRVNPFESVIPKKGDKSSDNNNDRMYETEGEKVERMLNEEEDELATADVIVQKIRRKVTYPMSFSVDRIVYCPKPEDGSKPPEDERKYELVSVLTHVGESVNSGHYVCFSRSRIDLLKKKMAEKDTDQSEEITEINGTPISKIWFCYDDDDVQDVSEEYITGLSSGGEGETPILLLYKLTE